MWPADGRETNAGKKRETWNTGEKMGVVKCWKKYTVVVISSLLWDMLCLLFLFWSFEVQRSRARDNYWEDFKLQHSEVGQNGFHKYATVKTALTCGSVILTHVRIGKKVCLCN